MIRLLGILVLVACSQAHAQSVETCNRAGMAGKARSDCGGYLALTDIAKVDPVQMLLVCPGATAGPASISACTSARWKVRTDLAAGDMVSLCSKATNPGWGNCGGSEEWRSTATVFDGAATPTPEPPATQPPTTADGTLTLNWTKPATNEDGSALSGITGYRIEYGQTAALGQIKDVGNVLTYTLTGLASGTWYASVRTLTSSGQSALSNAVSGTVTATTPPPPPPPSGPKWVVAPISSGSRPLVEPVLNLAGNAYVRGTDQGRVSVGVKCGAERFRVGTNSYRDIAEIDATLDSPTYKGRQHAALCIAQ